MKESMSTTRLFIAYSRKDAILLDELKTYLQPIVIKYKLTIWDDKEIDAGATWELEIKKNLISADIFLFLITANSLASDYFHNKELAFAIERHKKGEVQIIPIIMRSCGWKHSPIEELQVLPSDGKPVYSSQWEFISEAYTDILDGIEKVLLSKKEQKEKQIQEAKQKEINAAIEVERLRLEKEKQKKQAELAEKKKAEEATKPHEELTDWEKTKKDNKITVYQKFIKKYPQSDFNETAKNSIKLLRNKNKKARQKNAERNSTIPLPNFKTPKEVITKSSKVKTQAEKEDNLLEKGSIILEHSFYASLPVIGVVSIYMIKDNFQVPLVQNILDFQLVYVGSIIGAVLILFYQLIIVVDEYSYIAEEETEVKETIWGIVLTLISFGAISALGIFIISAILESIT